MIPAAACCYIVLELVGLGAASGAMAEQVGHLCSVSMASEAGAWLARLARLAWRLVTSLDLDRLQPVWPWPWPPPR